MKDGRPEAMSSLRAHCGTRRACESTRPGSQVWDFLGLFRIQLVDTHRLILRIIRQFWKPFSICSSWHYFSGDISLLYDSGRKDAKKI